MRIRLTIPGEPTAETLGIALEAATRLAQHDVRAGRVPPIEEAIAQGLRWQPEPPGDESFDPPHVAVARGWADCDDLAPYLAGEMRETGFDEGASAIAIPSGRNTWHAIVRGSDGEVYDPSKWAGMGHDVVGQCMPCSKPISLGKVGIAVARKSVRVDVPGLQARRGCVIGVAHECDCDATDEDRVVALIQTIEDAIVTAQLARTGDTRAIKALAVIYRVLRGDEISTACAGMQIRPAQVGIDFDAPQVRRFIQKAREILASAADELFNGETYTTKGGRVVKARKVALDGIEDHTIGFIPCLGALGGLATLAGTAGTIAAFLDPIAAALRELAGRDSDFGRAMATLREVLGPIKIAAAVGAGITSLAQFGNIPMAAGAGAARWMEILNAPHLLANVNNVAKLPEVAKVLAWGERALASKLPSGVATRLVPELLDQVKAGKYKEAVESMKGKILKFVNEETGFLPIDAATAEKMALEALKALADHNEPLDLPASPGSRIRTPATELLTLEERIAATREAIARLTAFGLEPNPHLIAALEAELARLIAQLEAAPSEAKEALAESQVQENVTATMTAEVEDAADVRESLRAVPIVVTVPAGWDPIFGMGCRQITDQCP